MSVTGCPIAAARNDSVGLLACVMEGIDVAGHPVGEVARDVVGEEQQAGGSQDGWVDGG